MKLWPISSDVGCLVYAIVIIISLIASVIILDRKIKVYRADPEARASLFSSLQEYFKFFIIVIMIISWCKFLFNIPYRAIFHYFTIDNKMLFICLGLSWILCQGSYDLLYKYVFSNSTKSKIRSITGELGMVALFFVMGFGLVLAIFYAIKYFVVETYMSITYTVVTLVLIAILTAIYIPIARLIRREYTKKKEEEAANSTSELM